MATQAAVTTRDAQETLEAWFRTAGHQVLANNARGDRPGPDYVVQVGERRVAVEVIGHKHNGVSRTNDFRSAFFQLLTRLDDPAGTPGRLALAMPIVHVRGSRDRRTGMNAAWERIGEAFPELEVWYLDMRKRDVYPVTWADYGTDRDPVVMERERRREERRSRRKTLTP
jgi:hypothetical protein